MVGTVKKISDFWAPRLLDNAIIYEPYSSIDCCLSIHQYHRLAILEVRNQMMVYSIESFNALPVCSWYVVKKYLVK